MARLNPPSEARGQFAAIARVRWWLFINSLRTTRGRLEMISRIFIGLGFAAAGIGGTFGLAVAAWFLVSHGKVEWLAALLWPVFLFWQLFPVMATAFTDHADSSHLLRFPLSYRSYFLIRMVYGSLEPATALGSLWLLGLSMGMGIAAPALFPWAVVVLLVFGVLNVLLGRMIFAWLERWLARRRTREIIGFLLLLFIIGLQLIGPLMNRYGGKSSPAAAHLISAVLPVARILPPGVAARAITRALHGPTLASLESFAIECLYGIVFFWFLNLRLHSQFTGEILGEAVARAATRKEKLPIRPGWGLPGISGPVAAIFEKEIRYLTRSGPMLFILILPAFVLLIFRFAPGGADRGGGLLANAPDLAFPIAVAYVLLILTNLVYNNLGPDAAGIQFFFVSPVRFREILLAKNLAHGTVIAVETLLVWIAVCLLFRPPAWHVALATLAGLLFAAPVNLAAGNMLSLYLPKKIDFGAFGRQRSTNLTALASFGIQAAVFGLAAGAFAAARHLDRMWIATVVYLGLAAIAWVAYSRVLNHVDGVALGRRETLTAELSKV